MYNLGGSLLCIAKFSSRQAMEKFSTCDRYLYKSIDIKYYRWKILFIHEIFFLCFASQSSTTWRQRKHFPRPWTYSSSFSPKRFNFQVNIVETIFHSSYHRRITRPREIYSRFNYRNQSGVRLRCRWMLRGKTSNALFVSFSCFVLALFTSTTIKLDMLLCIMFSLSSQHYVQCTFLGFACFT